MTLNEQIYDLFAAEDQGFLLIRDITRIFNISPKRAREEANRLRTEGRIYGEKQPQGHWAYWHPQWADEHGTVLKGTASD